MPNKIGQNAIVHPGYREDFRRKNRNLEETINPANLVEKIFANQILHAAWDLERVRLNAGSKAAEPVLHAAANRATRNLKRALAEIRLIQSARANRQQPEQPILADRTTHPKGVRP